MQLQSTATGSVRDVELTKQRRHGAGNGKRFILVEGLPRRWH